MGKLSVEKRGRDLKAPPYATQLDSEEAQVCDTSLSDTTKVSANARLRGVVVGVNMVLVLLFLIVFWSAMYSFLSRPSQPITFLKSLTSNSFLFTFAMHFDVFLLILSSIFIAIFTCGMVGALRENVAVLEAYKYLLVVLVLVNTMVATTSAVWPLRVRNTLKASSYKEFVEGYRHSDDFQGLIDSLQKSLRCCGFSQDSFRDWDLNEYFRCNGDNPSSERCGVPFSCCRSQSPNGSQLTDQVTASRFCGHGVLLMGDEKAWERVNTRSCADAALSFVRENLFVLVGLEVLLNMFLVLMIVTTVMLHVQVKAVRAIYGAYHKALTQGQAAMERSGVTLPEKAPESPADAKGAGWFNWGKSGKFSKPIDVGERAPKYKRTKPVLPWL